MSNGLGLQKAHNNLSLWPTYV